MFCPACGAKAPDNARFCGNCRHNLQPQAPDKPADAGSTGFVQSEPAPVIQGKPHGVVITQGNASEEVSPLLKWGVVVGSLFMPFIAIVMGIIYLNRKDGSGETKSVGKMWLIVGIVFVFLWAIGSGEY